MKIGLAARWLTLQSGGAREYTEHLIDHLLAVDKENTYVVLYNSHRFAGRFPASREIVIPIRNRFLWDYVGLPAVVSREQLDLLWVPSYVVPFTVSCPSVTTFLDMAYFFMPEAYRRSDVLYMQHAIPGSVRRTSAILTISESTKHDITRLFPGAKSKITVTYLAPSPRYGRVTDEQVLASVRQKCALPEEFIFYAGSISPRKGLSLLLRAFADLARSYALPHSLVITGGRRWGGWESDPSREDLPWDRIHFLGHVPAEDLPAIYSLADLCVYPSLFEGFGLPVLEAMACGCPVVCSNLSSLPEVAGDAALMVDPREISSLTHAMHRALTEPQTRSTLVEKGLARAASFTWETTARKTVAVFEEVAGSGRSARLKLVR